MRVGDRIAERRHHIGYSQTRLAREAGVSQGTIGKLEAGLSSGSSHLHRIARVLLTTPAYLTGETDNPDLGAPLPTVSQSIHVVMRVELPSERALTAMFLGLLDQVDPTLPKDEQARLLAELLPIGLSQLSDVLPDHLQPPQRPVVAATAVAPARLDHEPQH